MLSSRSVVLYLLSALGTCAPFIEERADFPIQKRATLPPHWTSKVIGNATGLFPGNYRDGGGGGTVNGYQLLQFSDDWVTTGGPYSLSDKSNFKTLVPNSIVISSFNGGGPEKCADIGSNNVPREQVPKFSPDEDNATIWPNANIATLCGGQCGVTFYPVIQKSPFGYKYSTGAKIEVTAYGPVVTRPVQSIFMPGEVGYGLFSSFLGIDGYLYMFGVVTDQQVGNGIRMARTPSGSPFDRTQYTYWDGTKWTTQMPAYADGGKSNIFNTSAPIFGGPPHGPDTGEVWFNAYYGVYMIAWQAYGGDSNVYMVWSKNLAGGWSDKVSLIDTPKLTSYNYALHVYPNYDRTGRTLPVSFIQQATYDNPAGSALYIGWANVTFS